jgi:ABC-2 type transport system ATP-binding protein
VRSLRALGKTILLTTHYLDEAQELADRVAIVKDGRILAIGPPRELVAGTGGAGGHYRIAYRDAAGTLVEHHTDDPTALLAELTAAALARGEQLDDLFVGRPSLEDVYLELTADA